MIKQLNGIAAAFGFLTILPLPEKAREKGLGSSLKYFPLVGLFIGLLLALFDTGVEILFDAPLLTSALTVIAMAAVSKGLHIDGLADTFDGFLSSRPRDQIFEIMKDPRIGVMGAIAVFSVLALKVTALASLPDGLRLQAILLAPLAGRSAVIFEMAPLKYARTEGGLAQIFKKQCGPGHVIWTIAFLCAAGWWALGFTGVAAAAATLVATLVFAFYCRKKIGGFTGDTLGAACEIAELIPVVVILGCGGRWSFF